MVRALERWSSERAELEWLPQRRFDRTQFPSLGQYDWFSGIVLYCLVREVRPQRIVEFSTSSGYSTCFSALALAKNGEGIIETVDIDDSAMDTARARWAELGVADRIRFHHGDCRAIVPALFDAGPVDLLFIDTLHSEAMARWYLEHVVLRLRDTDLVHIHDVMPPEARVRIHGGPPWPHLRRPRERFSLRYAAKRWLWHAVRAKRPPKPREPSWDVPNWDAVEREASGNSFDGNYFDEARLLRPHLSNFPAQDVVYLHRLERTLADAYPELQAFAAADVIGRSLPDGTPLEWNDAVWTLGGHMKRVARSVMATDRV